MFIKNRTLHSVVKILFIVEFDIEFIRQVESKTMS